MTLVGLFFAHWVGDFLCQTQWMADNKSKNWNALTAHVVVYTTILFVFTSLLAGINTALVFALINGVLHFGTDACTSRLTSAFHAKGDTHSFFVTIGLDQAIHNSCLYLTMLWLIS